MATTIGSGVGPEGSLGTHDDSMPQFITDLNMRCNRTFVLLVASQ